MHNVTATLYRCAHCSESGTCSRGEGNKSCTVCIKVNELKGGGHVGLPCGICGGLGKAEPATERVNKRVAPLLALFVVILLLAGVAVSAVVDRHFTEILAFAAGTIGTILGFYFSGKTGPR
jgi:hypothetical protein